MTLQELSTLYSRHPANELLLSALSDKRKQHLLLTGLCASAKALSLANVFDSKHQTILYVAENHDDASYLQHDLASIASEDCVSLFPSAYRIRQRNHQPDESYAIQRTELLGKLSAAKPRALILTYPEALLDPVPAKHTLATQTLTLNQGDETGIDKLTRQLVELGFVRVDFVYEPGQFALRGGIVDIFSFSHEEPYRIDFFGDEIDSIRIFDIETQLSKSRLSQVSIIPSVNRDSTQTATLLDYLPADSVIVADDLSLVKFKLESYIQSRDNVSQTIDAEAVYQALVSYRTVEIAQKSVLPSYSRIDYHTTPQPLYHKNFDLIIGSFRQYIADNYRIYLLSDSKKQIDRIQAIFAEKEADLTFIAVDKTLHEGFVDADARICCFTDHQIFERFHKVQQRADEARKGKVLLTLKELNQLQIGDYVVDTDHGIGRFGGLVRTPVNGKMQEMIKLTYRDNDILFVSIHSLHRISKYKGKDGEPPHISKLGSGQWERMKDRAKAKVKDIARDLIQLYAQRRQEKGFRFSPDSYLQHELEASFIYEDTPDQQKATLDVKHDMQSPVPMDRLICGDVGFGKTEIAMRAAFKAASDGKQTAVLVPTTVLALQHYNTFRERFKDMPVTVEYLSRAKNQKQTKDILERLLKGEIDILIGTHKLVGKQVKFKDLGLLIIDEEQKFGVATKEKLRQIKVNVDTLTLTATPIPRTLQFSLLGARDLSVINTPPPNRYPIQTELITPADEDIIQEAVQEEINRNGQVFVVNDRVQSLETVKNKICRLCPEARVVCAHGQMPPEQVEEILADFINYEYDVLVSTSIIESGVDIPNVNTMIINHADHFGLSDLHQLRGRVGRSNRKAYCYLVAPELKLITADARRRLHAIETFADLGAGFNIAMQDLDIRGAGNMLGAEQSGFIADLGYETYQRILSEAVLELKQEEFSDVFQNEVTTVGFGINAGKWVNDCQLDSDLELGFPEDYIENISERINLYRELDGLHNDSELLEFKKRLIDRFGTLPQKAEELLMVVQLRWACISLGIEKVVLKFDKMIIYLPSNITPAYSDSPEFGKILQYVAQRPARCRFRQSETKKSIEIDQVRTIQGALNLINVIKSVPSN
ncbi:MAG: transcription-repair coupling factor [Paludibacteraceae bacterium]|nr:transcription-repair coupling factor [Paludibacteraceae bacterium]